MVDKEQKFEDWKFISARLVLLRHDYCNGKVNEFKHYTQKNINLIR